MKLSISQIKVGLKEIRRCGERMIPKAISELHARLKVVQKEIYQGEWIKITAKGKVITREAEARLVSERVIANEARKMKYPQNPALDSMEEEMNKIYKHQEGWPVLKDVSEARGKKDLFYSQIAAFHGNITPERVCGPIRIKRVIGLGGNRITSPWWLPPGVSPKDARYWREEAAVLDCFGHNGWIVTCELPMGSELKVWKGQAAGQYHPKTGQFLEGGGWQLFLDLGAVKQYEAEMLAAFQSGKTRFVTPEGLIFIIEKTHWTDAVGIWGFGEKIEIEAVQTQKLLKHERQSKVAVTAMRTQKLTNE